jgi:hypothetical protein
MRLVLAAILAAASTAAFADAVTYRGTLNAIPIVVEVSEPAETATRELMGRYFYLAKGIDIPLQATSVSATRLTLAEEAPCEGDSCDVDPNGLIQEPPPAAIWTLDVADSGARLSGTWTPAGGKALPIQLERIGTRPYIAYDPPRPADLADFSLFVLSGEGPLMRETSPYDFLKMDVPVTHSSETRWDKVAFDYVTDPRTLFAYPRTTDLGGTPLSLANDLLQQRDWGMRLAALNCRSQVYPSMTLGGPVPIDGGTLGGFDEEQIEVHYLSPQLISFSESGSLWCGNAYPENHYHPFNIDIATGRPIDLSRLFKGWIARDYASGELIDIETARADPTHYGWGADETLAAFVAAKAPSLGDAQTDEDCEYPGIIAEHLTISFTMPDHVVFGLDGLPHAAQACAQDLYEAPIAALKDLLLPEVNTYFPGTLD